MALTKENKNNYLGIVPDEIYKQIMSYVFSPTVALNRMETRYKWNTNLMINKCCMCNLSAKDVALAYNCGCNGDRYFDICEDGCKNQLICFGCAHE